MHHYHKPALRLCAAAYYSNLDIQDSIQKAYGTHIAE